MALNVLNNGERVAYSGNESVSPRSFMKWINPEDIENLETIFRQTFLEDNLAFIDIN